MRPNTLYSGDCLDIMKCWDDNCIDLIYLDPPFNSSADYNILFNKDQKGQNVDERVQFKAFKDTWHYDVMAQERVEIILSDTQFPGHDAIDGFNRIIPETPMMSYLSYMTERVGEMHRVLKDIGSLYFHCDHTASHYLKIIIDAIFGPNNFRNEIVWSYPGSPSTVKKDFPRKHDIILRYTKSGDWVFNADDIRVSYSQSSINRMKYAANKSTVLEGTEIKLNEGGKIPPTVWGDIQQTYRYRNEYLKYPTQKPLKLLERIILASSNKDDLILDPFCGCGTTAHASQNLRRKFIGIDISIYALNKICKIRLKDTIDLKIMGIPTTTASAKEMDPFKFEEWVVSLMDGFNPNTKQVGDGGIDGRATVLFKPEKEKGLVVAQIKQGKPSADAQRAFLSQIIGNKITMGVFVTLHKINTDTKTKCILNAGKYTLPGGTIKYPRLVYWSIEEYFAGIPPVLPEMIPSKEEVQRKFVY